jgi:hypothetical protein
METLNNKLPSQDLSLIEQIDKRLKRLEEQMLPVWTNVSEPIVEPKEVVNEVEQERWNVSVQPFKHNQNDHRVVIYYQDDVLSSAEAYKLQEEIKELLSKK